MGFLVGMEPAFRVGARRTATPSLQAGSWNLLSVWRLSAQLWAPLASAAVICLLSDSATQLWGGGFPEKQRWLLPQWLAWRRAGAWAVLCKGLCYPLYKPSMVLAHFLLCTKLSTYLVKQFSTECLSSP